MDEYLFYFIFSFWKLRLISERFDRLAMQLVKKTRDKSEDNFKNTAFGFEA